MTGNVTPAALTDDMVRARLQGARRYSYRDLEYLCRAYLQFGREAMSDEHLQMLCDAINKIAKGTP